MKRRVHAVAGSVALLTVLTFWISTAASEAFGTADQVILVKTAIPWGLLVLVPALAVTGASGLSLGRTRTDPPVAAKRRRMPLVAGIGLLVLVPCAFFLAGKASQGAFDAAFHAVQGLELAAGAINVALMSLNVRDGLAAAGRSGLRLPV